MHSTDLTKVLKEIKVHNRLKRATLFEKLETINVSQYLGNDYSILIRGSLFRCDSHENSDIDLVVLSEKSKFDGIQELKSRLNSNSKIHHNISNYIYSNYENIHKGLSFWVTFLNDKVDWGKAHNFKLFEEKNQKIIQNSNIGFILDLYDLDELHDIRSETDSIKYCKGGIIDYELFCTIGLWLNIQNADLTNYYMLKKRIDYPYLYLCASKYMRNIDAPLSDERIFSIDPIELKSAINIIDNSLFELINCYGK